MRLHASGERKTAYIPIFSIEGSVELNDVLSPIEIFEDTSDIPLQYIIIGSITSDENLIYGDDKQDERIYHKLFQKASLTEADVILNLRYYFRTIPGPFYDSRIIIEHSNGKLSEAGAAI